MDIQPTMTTIVESLKQIQGIQALVLGGSRAKGTHTAHSDIDIGIYYDPAKGFDRTGLGRAAAALDDAGREDVITEVGEWGPWINGGGWLTVNQIPVDFLYRDLSKVGTVMEQCLSGNVTADYQPGHPHGFLNAIYFSEVAWCKVLWDPEGRIQHWKTFTTPYPDALKKALIDKFFWEAAFALDNGRKGLYAIDLAYIAGCCFRSISCLNQVLFALNECYWMNEKGAVAVIETFRGAAERYSERVNRVFALVTDDPIALDSCLAIVQELIRETAELMERNRLIVS